MKHANGCVQQGKADRNDYIINCNSQHKFYKELHILNKNLRQPAVMIPDTEPPSISFNPSNLTTSSGLSEKLSLTYNDNRGTVSKPEITCTNGGTYSNGFFFAPQNNNADNITSICTAIIQDAAGNENTATLNVSILPPDTEPPIVTIDPSELTVERGQSAEFKVSVSDNRDGVSEPKITCYSGGTYIDNIYTAPDVGNDDWCQAEAYDAAGNWGYSGIYITLYSTEDPEAPIVTFEPSELTLVPGGSAEIIVTATDNIGVTEGPTVTCYNGGTYVDNIYTAPETGTYEWCEAIARDAVGNETSTWLYVSITDAITIEDTDPPVITFEPSELTVKRGESAELIVTASDNIGVTEGPTVTCYNGGTYVDNIYTAPETGTYEWCEAIARDAAGNETIEYIRVEFDLPVPTWTAGIFEPSENFKDVCEFPYENFWLRSWSDETYLWYSEITDQNPANFDDPLSYFDELKTTRTTASGNPVDQYHFTYDTDEYSQLTSEGASIGYGAHFTVLDETAPDREILIAYVEPDSPAANAGLKRGTRIIAVDGTQMADGEATVLINGLWPITEAEEHTLTVQAPNETSSYEVTLTSAIVTESAVHTISTETLSNGDEVGYILFNTFGTFPAQEQIHAAMGEISDKGVKELVLDLRYNGGGYVYISSQLGYMIAGSDATNGQIYDNLVFNDKHPTTNPITGADLSPTPFYDWIWKYENEIWSQEPNNVSLDLDTVYILTTDRTCSASEALINGLRGIDVNVVLIGGTTCGKPYGFYSTDNCGTTYFTIQFRGENAKGFGDYADGFSPSEGEATFGEPVNGCVIPDDYSKELGNPEEALFSAALTHIETGSCPTKPVMAKASTRIASLKSHNIKTDSLFDDPRIQKRMLLENSDNYTHPGNSRP